MQSQKFLDFFLVYATLLAVTIPSFIGPAIANPRNIDNTPDSIYKKQNSYLINGSSKGKIFDHSNDVNCAGISVYIKKLLSNGSPQKIISTQAEGNYQKDGFCSYSYPNKFKFFVDASSYIVVATDDRERDYCGDSDYCDVKPLGQDLSMYLHLH